MTYAMATAVGFGLGMQHALEPDHLVAVTTIVSHEHGLRRATRAGVLWGLGHTASLLLVGIVLTAIGILIPNVVSARLESVVAVMIIFLGMGAAFGHTHLDAPARWRPFAVGLVHGLAGSGALVVIVSQVFPNTAQRLAYIATFGCGSAVGMLVMSSLIGMPFIFVLRVEIVSVTLRYLAGISGVAFGAFMLSRAAYPWWLIALVILWAVPKIAWHDLRYYIMSFVCERRGHLMKTIELDFGCLRICKRCRYTEAADGSETA